MSRFSDSNSFLDIHYQQSDINISAPALWTCAAGALIVLAYLFHALRTALDYPVLSIAEILWNCFVWLMPSSLVLGLRPSLSSSDTSDAPSSPLSRSSEHAAKSEVLRTVFKLDSLNKHSLASGIFVSPPGLGNWDNSCYQNSVLQALASVRCLGTFFDNLRRNIADLPDDTTIASLDCLVGNLNDDSNSARLLWTPHRLKSMNSWQQQDAQEYFSRLIEDMEKETLAGWKRNRAALLPDSHATLAAGLSLEAQKPPNSTQDSLEKDARDYSTQDILEQRILQQLQSPVEGLIAQRVGCTRCGFSEGLSLIPFNCLTLPLGRSWSYDIRDCLEEYTAVEYIEGVECPKCSLLQMSTQLQLQQAAVSSAMDTERSANSEQLSQYEAKLSQRIEAIAEALDEDDFSDSVLNDKCHIPRDKRVSSTKSKQVMIMKAPQCLVLHVNRSVFDEYTGAQLKNYADVQYGDFLDLSRWCIGSNIEDNLKDKTDTVPGPDGWEMDSVRSMGENGNRSYPGSSYNYQLRAIITHLGRHENGHYVCYRKLPPSKADSKNGDQEQFSEAWWRLSDDKVARVEEQEALSQAGAYMLFYERIDDETSEEFISPPVDEAVGEPAMHSEQVQSNEEFLDLINDASSPPPDVTNLEEIDNKDTPATTEDYKLDKKATAPLKDDETQSEGTSSTGTRDSDEQVNSTLHEQDTERSLIERSTNILSPTEMRTAGLQPQHSQESEYETFKVSRQMVATT